MKRKKLAIIIMISILIVIIVAGGGFFAIKTFIFSENVEISTTKLEDYKGREQLLKLAGSDAHTLLLVFPELEYSSIELEEFFCEKEVGLFDSYYEIFLSYTLNEQEFEQEKERIAGLKLEMNREVHEITYSSDGFSYPAYVSIFTQHNAREYALLDEINHRIICVYNQISIDKMEKDYSQYLPVDFGQEDMLNGVENMYYFPGEKIMGTESYEMYE